MEKGLSLAYYVNGPEQRGTTTAAGTAAGSYWWSLIWTAAGLQIASGLFYILCALYLYIEKEND